MSWLLDGNVLASLALKQHVHYQRATSWFATLTDPVATCAVTEGTLLRLHMRFAADSSAEAAWATLARFRNNPRHVFIDDGFSYTGVATKGLHGHKQVTDAWLAQPARRHGARLATLDGGLADSHPDVGFLIPEPVVPDNNPG